MTDRIELTRPDDWHVHFRDGSMLEAVAPETARDFGRAIVMPNLIPPVVTASDASAYRERILSATDGYDFDPQMTLYLTENTDKDDLAEAFQSGLIRAVKLYPAGATTNSDSGVSDFKNVMPVLEKMAEIGCTLCVHGEVTTPEIDIFDREAVFIETILDPIRTALPELRVTMEHITTKDAVDYVMGSSGPLGATITTHHPILNRNDLLVGGIKPHYYCLPVVKREKHRLAVRKAATSGDPRFFLGTDSAPHLDPNKLSSCGCAGVFSASNTMPLLAHIFEEDDALDKLEGFASLHGAAHYGVPANTTRMVLEKDPQADPFPAQISTPEGPVTLFDPGFTTQWRVVD